MGLAINRKSIPPTKPQVMLRPWPSWQNALRRLWLTLLSLYFYGYELVTAIQLTNSPTHDGSLIFTLCTLIMGLYAIALLRAWELLGVQRASWLAWLNPLYEINKIPDKKAGEAESQLGDTA